MIEIYTDGSCCGNGKETNVGGFGVVSMCGNLIKDKYGCRYENTTNNRMEMEALLYALDLSQTKYQNDKVIIYSDSAYCVNIFNNWIHSWARNGWTRAGNKTIENLDLVKYVSPPIRINGPISIFSKMGRKMMKVFILDKFRNYSIIER